MGWREERKTKDMFSTVFRVSFFDIDVTISVLDSLRILN